jgi:putative mRNA 3-end processing factor
VFITEATFGLPVFTHPPATDEAAKLLESLRIFPERTHLVGAYALGKTQRLIAVLRQLGYDDPIYLHGALIPVCATYERLGVALGALREATKACRPVVAPPHRTGHRAGFRMDAGAPARQSERYRIAAGDLRSCRLARTAPDA